MSLDSDESQELSSLLERFDFASEPISDDLVNPGGDHKSISEPLNEAIAADIPTQDFASFVLQAEQDEIEMIDHSEAEHVRAERLVAPDPVAVQPDMDALSEPKGDEEEESVEDYMKRLMARMRGGSLEEEPKLSSPPPVALAPATSAPPVDSTSPSKITLPAPVTERVPSSTTSPFNPEEYVPKALAPEKNRNMAAMRELANTSARSAIQVSARRRYGTAIALKLAIALIGLGVGVTLVMINGFNVNIGLIAAIASFLVALIWGFDAFTTLKPLLRTAGETIESAKPTEPEGGL